MNDEGSAEQVRDVALQAVSHLSQILVVSRGHCSAAEFDRLRKGVGLAIGKIQEAILDPIYAQYPDLDDLK